jgi:hypothetical protein
VSALVTVILLLGRLFRKHYTHFPEILWRT